MKNSSVVELFIFIVFVGFVGFMMNSEMELENNNLLTNGEKIISKELLSGKTV